MRTVVFLASGLLIFALGCKKDEQTKPTEYDAFLFGSFFGECVGPDCVKTYRISEEKLWEAATDVYAFNPGAGPTAEGYPGPFVELSADLYELAKDLPDQLPEELFQETQNVFGQPDAGDWGGLYVEVVTDGQHYVWILDNMETNMPEYLHDFAGAIRQTIDALQP